MRTALVPLCVALVSWFGPPLRAQSAPLTFVNPKPGDCSVIVDLGAAARSGRLVVLLDGKSIAERSVAGRSGPIPVRLGAPLPPHHSLSARLEIRNHDDVPSAVVEIPDGNARP